MAVHTSPLLSNSCTQEHKLNQCKQHHDNSTKMWIYPVVNSWREAELAFH